MLKEVIGVGRDVQAALADGYQKLGVTAEDGAEYEVISRQKSSLFGFKKEPAKVRVFINEPEKTPAEPKPEEKPTTTTPVAPKTEEKPAVKKSEEPKPEKVAPAVTEKVAVKPEIKNENEEKIEKVEKVEEEIEPTPEVREKVEKAVAYLKSILDAMGHDTVEVKPVYYKENVRFILCGNSLGSVIGRRGETLDSIQYLTSLVANRGEGAYVRVNIDTGNYREKREKTLIELSKKVAKQVISTGKTVRLESMNSYERRIIHGAISKIDGVYSTSSGIEPARRVVICLEGTKPTYSKGGNGKGRYNNNKPRNKRPYDKNSENKKDFEPKKNSETNSQKDSGETATESAALKDAQLLSAATVGVPIVGGVKPKKETPAPAQQPEVEKPKTENPNEPKLYGKL